ncbi:type II toxin-antitoxin system YafQ family toxin [Dysosmobacter sp.]|uniref:type II toxin-antitoxin system YafQ family toxin n=1 Tax=Dysosmobacter sp. TaxID=2591382 RepID=UPI003AB843B2
MRKTKYTVKYTTAFKKDYKRAIKRGLKIELLEQVVALLSMGEPLPDKNRDHDLSGDWMGHRECHILPDWLLIYSHAAGSFPDIQDVPVLSEL